MGLFHLLNCLAFLFIGSACEVAVWVDSEKRSLDDGPPKGAVSSISQCTLLDNKGFRELQILKIILLRAQVSP